MSCNCTDPQNIRSWYGLQNSAPKNPLDLIAYASLNSTAGIFEYSDTFLNPGGVWVANSFTVNTAPFCIALGSDSQQQVADAEQWNFQHLTANLEPDLAVPMRKVLYLRGGTQWKMSFNINFGVGNYDDVQLSFRDNAGTRGDYAGDVPVITFPGAYTGIVTMEVVLKQFGHAMMGLRVIDAGGDRSMYESERVIVP